MSDHPKKTPTQNRIVLFSNLTLVMTHTHSVTKTLPVLTIKHTSYGPSETRPSTDLLLPLTVLQCFMRKRRRRRRRRKLEKKREMEGGR